MVKSKSNSKLKSSEVECVPDAWQRFERAVDAAVKHGPEHRVKPTASRPKNASPKPRKKA